MLSRLRLEEAEDRLQVEDVDPDTGELLGTRFQRVDADGEPMTDPLKTALGGATDPRA